MRRTPTAASFCDPFAYIVPTMRAKRSQKSARRGSPSRRRSLVRQAPSRLAFADPRPVFLAIEAARGVVGIEAAIFVRRLERRCIDPELLRYVRLPQLAHAETEF